MNVDLREDGLLWLINRTVFHPRGFAMGVGSDGGVTLYGDGAEPWHYAVACEVEDPSNIVNEDEKFAAVEAVFDKLRQKV